MNETQLKALVGCILKYKAYEAYIKDIKNGYVVLNIDTVLIETFILDFLPNWKIYLTEDEESLVPIEQYLKHYDIK